MKLTAILLTIFCLQVSARSFSQNITISAQNIPLEQALTAIEKQSGYFLFYKYNELKDAKPVNLRLKQASLQDALEQSLKGQPFNYTIADRTIIISRRPEKSSNAKSSALIDIRGTVTDDDGQPLPGASIKVKGSVQAVVSDINGRFRLSNVNENAVLVISFTGFIQQEIAVANRSEIIVKLKEAVKAINEVVVTALGIKREEKALGYAITKLDSTQITNAPAGNWVDALSGKVPGLNMVRSNGGPSGSNKIILRGENNLTGENEALIVVDGVVINSSSGKRTATGGEAAGSTDGIQPTDFGSGLNDLNPDDIESVTVLRGPGASALYGQRGANGAIIITTKSGKAKSKAVSVSFTSNVSFESPNRWPSLQYEYGQGLNGASTYAYGTNSNTSLSWGPRFNGQSFIQYDPVTQKAATEATPWVAYPGQVEKFFDTGRTLTNSLSLSGSLKNTTYRLAATHANNTWIIPNTGFERTNVSFSTNTKVNSKLNFSIKANYTNKSSDNLPGMGYGNQSVMYWYVFWVPNADINWLRNYWTNGKEYQELHDVFTSAPENPYAISYEFINASKRNNLIGNAQVNYQFSKDLSMQLRGTIDRSGEDRSQRRPWTAARLPTGSFRTQDIAIQEVSADWLLKYDKQVNRDFHLTATAGGSMLRNHYYKSELRADGLLEPNVYTLENAANALVSVPDTSRFRINSVYGLLSGSYKDYLYLDLTARQDWSSTLANPTRKNAVGFFYPSANLSFLASQFFELPRSIDLAKLRLSVSQTGSGGTVAYRTSYAYPLAANGTYPDGALENPSTLPNPDLKPFRTTAYELGADIRMFKSRLGLDVAVYTGNTKNQILDRIVDRSSGFTRQIINAGQINNSGLEIGLNATPLKTKDFRWKTFFTFSTNKNRIKSMANTDSTVILRSSIVGGAQIVAKVGGSLGDLYGLGFERSPDGQVIYETSGLPKLGTTPIYLGNTIPKYKGSVGTEFGYKGFRLNVLFDGQQGAVGHSYTHGRLADFGKLTATLPGRYSGITGRGVVANADGTYSPNTKIVTDITSFYNYTMGTANGEGATFKTDFIKFREARLDYSLPRSVLKPLKLSRATVGVWGRNLFIWSTWPMFDPEFGTLSGTDIVQGFEVGQFPSTRTFGFNLLVGLN